MAISKITDNSLNITDLTIADDLTFSSDSAVINFKKTSDKVQSGKIAVAFCYYINRGRSKGWKYFFPTDSHLHGFYAFQYYKLEAERKNYKHNFKKQT